jgi:hypothetical protein
VSDEIDGPYEALKSAVASAKSEFNAIMAKNDNKHNDGVLGYNIGKAFALAALPNFTYLIQDRSTVVSHINSVGENKTALGTAFGVDGYTIESEYLLKITYEKISDAVDSLTEAKRNDYLTLMYGDYYAETYEALTRTERAGEAAPAKKLVFIGSRHNGYPELATKAEHGIGQYYGVPMSYAELDAKYKTALLFATEEDYNVFLDVLRNDMNYTEGASEEAKKAAQWGCFGTYINYIYTLKLTYALYGEDYDIIMKGHPREVIGAWSEWGGRYNIAYGSEGGVYCYDQLLDAALLAFHKSDSIGKYIGMVPYGTSAENLAYLGADIAIAGLPSSTYNGFDPDVEVLFILADTAEDISGNASQVKSRYEAGTLFYTDKNGEKQTTVFYNTGNIYKALASIYASKGDTAMAEKYNALFASWLEANRDGKTDIDAQGFGK